MPKPFEQLIAEMRNGRVAEQLTDTVEELVQAIRNTGKGGTLTLTLSMKPSGENGIEIDTKVTAKAPKPDVGKSFYFLGSEGELSRTDPRQAEMRLAGVTPIRTATAE